MLDAKDLEAIGNLIDEKLDKKLDEKLDKKFAEFEERFEKKLDKRLEEKLEARVTRTEALLLDEMDRMKGHLDDKIDRLGRDVEEMKQYYRIDRLENQTITVMMRSIEDLRKDVDELKEVAGA